MGAKKLRPVLRYFGGKFRLADWIISHMPAHKIYVEPYGGAASVLMKKPRCYAEVWNDLDAAVYNLFWTLKHEDLALKLKHQLEHTPFSRHEFELAHSFHPDPIESARRLIVRSFMGFGADSCTNHESKTGFRAVNKKTGQPGAKDWINYSRHIDSFVERLKGVTIECRDAIQVMREHDSEETLHYVDPPYTHDTRRGGRYQHEMDMVQHRELLDCLSSLAGRVILSGYDNEMYNTLGWRKEAKVARADKAGLRTEVLWIK